MNIYYVYQYLRENGTPYYIGKGSGRRAYSSNRVIPKPPNVTRIQIVAHKLSESEAFLLETKLIAIYGRIDLGAGILHNKTNGGDGAPAVSNKVAWNKGKTQSPEHNLKISTALKDYKRTQLHQEKINQSLKGRDPTFLGKTHSSETREILRQANLGKKRGPTPEHVKQKIRESQAKRRVLMAQSVESWNLSIHSVSISSKSIECTSGPSSTMSSDANS
jgi:hypothetical protein